MVNMRNGPFWRLIQQNLLLLWLIEEMVQTTFLRVYTFSPRCTLINVGGMAQGGEWSRLRNQDIYSSLLEKNSSDSSSLMFYLFREDALPRSHRCEWKNGPDDSVYVITLFLCRLISDDCYGDCMSPDSRDMQLWWTCSTVCDYVSRFE